LRRGAAARVEPGRVQAEDQGHPVELRHGRGRDGKDDAVVRHGVARRAPLPGISSRSMKISACLLLSLLAPTLGAAPLLQVAGADKKEWVALFDGKSLDGWIPKIKGYEVGVNYGDTFRVENGVLKVVYDKDKYPTFDSRFGHLFYKTPFSHYIVAVEYRFVGEQSTGGPDWAFRNSGVMYHGQPAATMLKDQDFPVCMEGQLLGGKSDGTARSTANVCTPGTNLVMDGKLDTRHCINSTSKTFDGDQWVRAEFEVHGGGEVIHRVNGEV